jgi:hypothetical protein
MNESNTIAAILLMVRGRRKPPRDLRPDGAQIPDQRQRKIIVARIANDARTQVITAKDYAAALRRTAGTTQSALSALLESEPS